jgi:hypothetical protein
MKEKEIERLVLGIDENQKEAWETLQKQWSGGALIMPLEEVERRKTYKSRLREIFLQNNITPETVQDDWLKGKIRRILK